MDDAMTRNGVRDSGEKPLRAAIAAAAVLCMAWGLPAAAGSGLTAPTAPPPLTQPIGSPAVQPLPPTQPVQSGTMPVVIPGGPIAPGSIQRSPIAVQPIPTAPAIWQFANPVAVVIAPTTVEVRWATRPGATGYRIWRNGVAIANVPALPSAQVFDDAGLAPVFANTYKVWAMQAGKMPTKDPLGTLLEESNLAYANSPAPVSQTPAHVRPTGITATIIAAGATNVVRVTWHAAPGAAGYFVSRDGNVFGGMQTGTTLDDSGVPNGGHFYFVQSVYPKQGGGFDLAASTVSSPVRIRLGPLNMIAVGDSIMWGQGLADMPGRPHKFTSLVRDWVQTAMGKQVTLMPFAHSGAIITPGNLVEEGTVLPGGEAPSSFPTVGRQALTDAVTALTRSGIRPEDVDLVLVDGCVNDIGITTVLDPSKSDDDIAGTTMRICGGMAKLLSDIHGKYPNAKIILTGYFPIVSTSSDLTAVVGLVAATGVVLSAAVAGPLGIPLDPATGTIVASLTLRSILINHSGTFLGTSNAALAMAANTANGNSRSNWVTFVTPGFQANNAYAAPNSWLWLVPTGLFPKDEVFSQRQQLCSMLKNTSGTDLARCVEASMGHPNVMGAQAYADAITAALATSVPTWQQIHATVQQAP
jgi:hypothetical protein